MNVDPRDAEPRLSLAHRSATAVGGATAASGIGLMMAPSLVLRLLSAGRSEPAPFLFRIIGMFMTVSGGLLADGARAPEHGRVPLRWALAAKVGAAIYVGWGVRSDRFGKQALALAAFDACAAALIVAAIAQDS